MKNLFIFLCVISLNWCFSQNIYNKKISIQADSQSTLEILNEIELQTNYKFFYQKTWLENLTYTGNYTNVELVVFLNDLFDKTEINYFVRNEKVILSLNNLIINELPNNYFEDIETPITEDQQTSVPQIILGSNEASSKNYLSETIRIGKEDSKIKKSSYTLSGYVINDSTNRPINNLELFTSDKKISTQTNDEGYYSISLPYGINYLEAKGLGLKGVRKRIIMFNDGNLNFSLSEEIETLDEVLIEADRDENVKDVLSGVMEIKAEDIKTIPLILGERDILKVATTLPGITTAGEGSSGYNVRGGREDQNLILLDNGVIYNPTHFFGIFSAINPFTSGDVNIYKGNIPSEYGGRLSSVFDISSKVGNMEKLSVEASVGPVTGNISAEIPIVKNKSSLILGGRSTYSEWLLESLDNKSLQNSEASFYDVIGKYTHLINDKNSIEATGYYSGDRFSITSDSLFNYNNRLMSLKWHHEFNDKHSSDLIVSNSQYKFDIEFDADSDRDFDLNYRISETEFKLKMRYLMNSSHKFNYGISTKLYNVNPGIIEPLNTESIVKRIEIPEERALESAVFISDNFSPNERLSFDLGLRFSLYTLIGPTEQRFYDDNAPRNTNSFIEAKQYGKNEVAQTYGGPELRLGTRYLINPSLSLKASLNTGYQYIHMLSNNTTIAQTDTWKLSDVNIKPQTATQFSLGIFKNLNQNLYELSLEGYYKTSKNLLDYKVGSDLLLNETVETEVIQGDGKAWGIEFLIKKTKGKLNGWLSYTYSRSLIRLASDFREEQVNNGDYFPSNFDKPHNLNFIANYRLTKRFSLSGNFTYQTGRPVTIPTASFNFGGQEFVTYSDRNAFRIPDYYRLDLGLNIEGNHKSKKLAHSFWNISVYNVLGRNNPYSVFFVTENGEIQAYQSSIFTIPVPTITYNLKF